MDSFLREMSTIKLKRNGRKKPSEQSGIGRPKSRVTRWEMDESKSKIGLKNEQDQILNWLANKAIKNINN